MAVSEASAMIAVGAPGTGWDNNMASANAVLALSKAVIVLNCPGIE